VFLARTSDQELLLLPGKPDYPVSLSQNHAVLLVADMSVTVVSFIVAFVAKTLNRP
jgi:hypothetical protein